MAKNLQLVTKSGGTTWSFLTNNVQPMDRITSPNGDGWVTETFTMRALTTDASIIANVATLDEFGNSCELFWSDPHNTESVWLIENATDETPKRALCRSVELTPITQGKFNPLLGSTGMQYVLTIVRSAAWEAVSGVATSGTNVSSVGGTLALPAIDGSMPGRIYQSFIYGDATSVADQTTIWAGIKPHYLGDSDFDPIVELENANLNTSAALGTDTNASPAATTDNVVTYATDTVDYKILWCALTDAFSTSTHSHWMGDYQVLLRCKLSTTNTVRVHVDTGYKYGTSFIPGPYAYIDNSTFQFIEAGSISIPPVPKQISRGVPFLRYYEFQVYAKNMGSAATITLDCIVLIPTTHYTKFTNALIVNNPASYALGSIYEDGSEICENYDASAIMNLAAQFATKNWNYPIAGGTLVVAGQEAVSSGLIDQVGVTLNHYERFRTHAE